MFTRWLLYFHNLWGVGARKFLVFSKVEIAMKTKHPVVSERRCFLKSMIATGGAAVLAAMAPRTTGEASEPGADGTSEGQLAKGYRLAAHVRDYYRSLRI